jgi:hypothetical protein
VKALRSYILVVGYISSVLISYYFETFSGYLYRSRSDGSAGETDEGNE